MIVLYKTTQIENSQKQGEKAIRQVVLCPTEIEVLCSCSVIRIQQPGSSGTIDAADMAAKPAEATGTLCFFAPDWIGSMM